MSLDNIYNSDNSIAREIQIAVNEQFNKFMLLEGEYKSRLTSDNKFKVRRRNKVYTVTVTTDE